MSDGGGNWTELRAVAADGSVSPSAKLYHYAAGTSNDKDIYSDEALTTAVAQPFVSDSAGRFIFYGNGDYKFVVKTSADVTLDTWDNVHVSTGQSFINDYGTDYPADNANNTGQGFAKIVSGVLRGVGINNGTAFDEFYTADASGNQQIGSVLSKTMPVYNVKHADWGAVGDGSTDDTTAIQSAITAIAAAGGGVLYFPWGTYKVTDTLNIDNTSIKICGDGAEHSIIKQTVDTSAAAVIDFDSNNRDDKVVIDGISVTTTVVGATSGIDITFTGGAADDRTTPYINDVYVGPHKDSSATAYFTDNIVFSGVDKAKIVNSIIAGHDTLVAGSDGISGISNCHISNVTFENLEIAIALGSNAVISNNRFRSVAVAIDAQGSTTTSVITGNLFDSIATIGIRFAGAGPIAHKYHTITGNTFTSSDNDCDFITGVDVTKLNTITGNTFFGATGSTSTGITLGSNSDENVIVGNLFFTLDTGIAVGGDDNIISSNIFNSLTTNVTDTGSNVYSGNTPQTVTVPSAAALGASVPGAKYIDFWSVTGTTSVTSIHSDVDSPIGRIITLKFAGVLTFTDGNNLLLDGNFVTAATDVIRLQFDGTNWNELGRSANST